MAVAHVNFKGQAMRLPMLGRGTNLLGVENHLPAGARKVMFTGVSSATVLNGIRRWNRAYICMGVSRYHYPGTRCHVDMQWQNVVEDGLPDDTYAVCNFAGKPAFTYKNWGFDWNEIVRSRFQTNEVLINAMRKNPPKLFIGVSNAFAYKAGNSADAPWDEDKREDDASTRLGRLALDLEQQVFDGLAGTGTRVIMLRPGIILHQYGAGKYIGRVGDKDAWLPWIHPNDYTRLIQHCLENEEVEGIVNAVAPARSTAAQYQAYYVAQKYKWYDPLRKDLKSKLDIMRGGYCSLLQECRGPLVFPRKALNSGFEFEHINLKQAIKSGLSMPDHFTGMYKPDDRLGPHGW